MSIMTRRLGFFGGMDGFKRLLEIAKQKKVCIMCLEPNPKYCHRRYISAHLEEKGVKVMHILKKGQTSLIKFKSIMEER